MKQLSENANDTMLPVNSMIMEALVVHSVAAPQLPTVKYRNETTGHVQSFSYLGATTTTKLGWSTYISNRLRKLIFNTIPNEYSAMQRKLFLAFALLAFVLFILHLFLMHRALETKHWTCLLLRFPNYLPSSRMGGHYNDDNMQWTKSYMTKLFHTGRDWAHI
jgi:hypothetical protein